VKLDHPIVLYDGVCGLCNHLVQFLLRHDYRDRFRFASLQSELSQTLLARHGFDPKDLDTVYVVRNNGQANEALLSRSDAILFMLKELGGIWNLSRIGKILPPALRNVFYDLVARNRYRVFGKYESCMLPSPEQRAKFFDV